MPNPSTYVHPIHFEDFDGFQFERLVFAYHVRADNAGRSRPGSLLADWGHYGRPARSTH